MMLPLPTGYESNYVKTSLDELRTVEMLRLVLPNNQFSTSVGRGSMCYEVESTHIEKG